MNNYSNLNNREADVGVGAYIKFMKLTLNDEDLEMETNESEAATLRLECSDDEEETEETEELTWSKPDFNKESPDFNKESHRYASLQKWNSSNELVRLMGRDLAKNGVYATNIYPESSGLVLFKCHFCRSIGNATYMSRHTSENNCMPTAENLTFHAEFLAANKDVEIATVEHQNAIEDKLRADAAVKILRENLRKAEVSQAIAESWSKLKASDLYTAEDVRDEAYRAYTSADEFNMLTFENDEDDDMRQWIRKCCNNKRARDDDDITAIPKRAKYDDDDINDDEDGYNTDDTYYSTSKYYVDPNYTPSESEFDSDSD